MWPDSRETESTWVRLSSSQWDHIGLGLHLSSLYGWFYVRPARMCSKRYIVFQPTADAAAAAACRFKLTSFSFLLLFVLLLSVFLSFFLLFFSFWLSSHFFYSTDKTGLPGRVTRKLTAALFLCVRIEKLLFFRPPTVPAQFFFKAFVCVLHVFSLLCSLSLSLYPALCQKDLPTKPTTCSNSLNYFSQMLGRLSFFFFLHLFYFCSRKMKSRNFQLLKLLWWIAQRTYSVRH